MKLELLQKQQKRISGLFLLALYTTKQKTFAQSRHKYLTLQVRVPV